MKALGIILIVLGSLMVLSGLRLGFTQYNLSDSHDMSKFLGGLGLSVLLLAVGVTMLVKSRK